MKQAGKTPASWLWDLMGVAGLFLVVAGITAQFGWPWAAMTTGGLFLIGAIWGASR